MGRDPDTYSIYKRNDEIMEDGIGNKINQNNYDYGNLAFWE